MKRTVWLYLCLTGSLMALPAQGAPKPVGYVMTVQGDVTIMQGNKTLPVQIGAPVLLEATFTSGDNSSFGITLEDGSVMSFGPQSEFRIEAFEFAPAKSALRMAARLKRGTLNYVAGTIAKLKPEAVEILTPNGTIASRSAQFMAKIDHE
jgi:hypothetical protein